MGTRNRLASVWVAAKSWWDVLMKYPIQQNSVALLRYWIPNVLPIRVQERAHFVCEGFLLLAACKDCSKNYASNPPMFGYSVAWFVFEDEITRLKFHRSPTRLKH